MPELRLQALAPALWSVDHPFKTLGAELGTRTRIVQLASGGLWLLSPGFGLTRQALEALGPVEAVVAPNTMHHLALPEIMSLFPTATLYGPPGLKAKQPDLSFTRLNEAPWREEIPLLTLAGLGNLQETAFLHPPSGTLMLTDLVFNLRRPQDAWTRLFMRLDGGYDKVVVTRLLRSLVRDKQALKASLAQLLSWDFERLTMAHGEIVESRGKAILCEALAAAGLWDAI